VAIDKMGKDLARARKNLLRWVVGRIEKVGALAVRKRWRTQVR
jgi:predicted nuclease with TOPRIM domain